jgi:hypothetical protein
MSSTAISKADQARVTLDSLGERRARLKADEETLREDTRIGLRAARGLVPIAEAAQRAGLNRSTVYELYLGNAED